MRRGASAEVSALLAASAALSPAKRAGLAAAAVTHADQAVKLEAIALLAVDAQVAVRHLGLALSAAARPVRLAAVQALASCSGAAEPATGLLLQAMARPQFARVDKDERTAFFRSVGKLGARDGLAFLVERLTQPPRKMFKGRKGGEEQLLAVQGLV